MNRNSLENFNKQVKNIIYDENGMIVGISGSGKASDFRAASEMLKSNSIVWDSDFCKEVGIRRIMN